MNKRITGRYTGNFYDDSEPTGTTHSDEWESEAVDLEYWHVFDTADVDDKYGNPQGVILSGDIGPYGLLEVVLTRETLEDMLSVLADGEARANPYK